MVLKPHNSDGTRTQPKPRLGLEPSVFFFFLINSFIYFWLHWLFVAAWAFSSCGEQGLLFVAVRGLLIAVASLVAEHGL